MLLRLGESRSHKNWPFQGEVRDEVIVLFGLVISTNCGFWSVHCSIAPTLCNAMENIWILLLFADLCCNICVLFLWFSALKLEHRKRDCTAWNMKHWINICWILTPSGWKFTSWQETLLESELNQARFAELATGRLKTDCRGGTFKPPHALFHLPTQQLGILISYKPVSWVAFIFSLYFHLFESESWNTAPWNTIR